MGNLSTPKSVQKLQTALHAKAKAEVGYRFYALYDKISREDILAHAHAQCRSNKGAPGVDGQDFADIEAYGVQRWLGELALALRQETYRPDPIRRVFIPKANGKLRPLGISNLRDRVCMTAAMLVLEPIFEADLPSCLPAVPSRSGLIVVAPIAVRIWRIVLRTASRKARLAFSIRCQRSATWVAFGNALAPLSRSRRRGHARRR